MNGPTKPDARIFLKHLQSLGAYNGGTQNIRPIIREMQERHDVPEKRCLFLLDKWSGKDWYDYGMVIDGGWLTDAGMSVEVNE